MKSIQNLEITDPYTEEAFTVDNPLKAKRPKDESVPFVIPLTVHHAIRMFLNSAFRGQQAPPTMEESARATRIFTSIRRTERDGLDVIELDDSDYEWFLEKFEILGPSVFHINAFAIKSSFREVDDDNDVERKPLSLSKVAKRKKRRQKALVK